jgi:hypothetical protein
VVVLGTKAKSKKKKVSGNDNTYKANWREKNIIGN